MIQLDNISKIGFGAYRVEQGNPNHREALEYALDRGCNLIDTASNYGGGASELLIGEVLNDNRPNVFLVTKAGYLAGEELNEINGLTDADVLTLPDGTFYSIHPLVLKYKIQLSCARLRISCIDGFLLHNPEYLFDHASQAENENFIYEQVQRAFEFLETQVATGCIRYYGISSNKLPFSAALPGTLNLQRILNNLAGREHHFRIIEFPLNLLENTALHEHSGGKNIIELAKANGLTIMSNRPLNARLGNEFIRLAVPKKYLDLQISAAVMDECLAIIASQLKFLGLPEDPMQHDILRFVKESWLTFDNEDALDSVFLNYFFPWVTNLYQGQLPEPDKKRFTQLYSMARMATKKNMATKSQSIQSQLITRRLIDGDEAMPFASLLCKKYLSFGVDHVLIGMRSKDYVDEVAALM